MKVSYLCIFVLIVIASIVNVSKAATCNAVQLSPCLGPIMSGTPPTPTCCTQLRSQSSCFCQYVRNPSLRQYVNSPNARKLANTCRVAFPRC
ncbi:Non-specific lipid-transfer protein [Thalictrum thalictroides]|uniref:Non-specific lipid-transfer protein n=1 Tax=Thalictrum thalictroides TaxID=46969 RepID=A0A7J6VAI7_THATH|nr:Non-specific lipid-transfer protein [Thalictrum thalictroides]